MRAPAVIFALLLGACADDGGREQAAPPSLSEQPLTPGESRTRLAGEAGAVLRSGPQVPVSLPRDVPLYPGARIVSNTVVERGGARRALLVFETPDRIEEVMLFYRAAAQAAGMAIALDLGGEQRASLGGTLPTGEALSIAARRAGAVTRVELGWG